MLFGNYFNLLNNTGPYELTKHEQDIIRGTTRADHFSRTKMSQNIIKVKIFLVFLELFYFYPCQAFTIPESDHQKVIISQRSKVLEKRIMEDRFANYEETEPIIPTNNLLSYKAGPVTELHDCSYQCITKRPWQTYYHHCVISYEKVENMCLCQCVPRYSPHRQRDSLISGRS